MYVFVEGTKMNQQDGISPLWQPVFLLHLADVSVNVFMDMELLVEQRSTNATILWDAYALGVCVHIKVHVLSLILASTIAFSMHLLGPLTPSTESERPLLAMSL